MMGRMEIPFNKSVRLKNHFKFLEEVLRSGDTSGNGIFGRHCEAILSGIAGKPVRLTNSGSSALEMMSILLGIGPGDEVIIPSFTFPSTANAFALRGVKLRFADNDEFGNISVREVARLINKRTRAAVAVHYAGTSADMDPLLSLCHQAGIFLVEDAAQALGAEYRGRPLGALGTLGCYSFHETKNYICGEGGALCINDPHFIERAEILRDKGTNRQQFFRGEVDKYTWVDIGSSYVPSEIASAFLFGQLEMLDAMRVRRRAIFDNYSRLLKPLIDAGLLRSPVIPMSCESNYHTFYCLLPSAEARDAALDHCRANHISAVFHYVPLHSSPFCRNLFSEVPHLPVTDDLSARLLRLPMFYELTETQQHRVSTVLAEFCLTMRSESTDSIARNHEQSTGDRSTLTDSLLPGGP